MSLILFNNQIMVFMVRSELCFTHNNDCLYKTVIKHPIYNKLTD